MKTFEEAAPHGGKTLFYMSAVATATEPLSNSFNPSVIKDELQELAKLISRICLRISIQPHSMLVN